MGVLGRVLIIAERRLGMVLDRFTHVSGVEEGRKGEGGEEERMGGLSDLEARPGGGRVVGQKAPNEVSGPGGCPGKGLDRQFAFWGRGRGGKDDKSSDD